MTPERAGAPLLEPVRLGPRTAPNRIFFGPHETNLGRGRAISDRHVAYYARRARGGAGLIVTETASVHASDWPYERAPLAAECGAGWAAVAGVAHRHGSLALAGLGHAGGQGSSAFSQAPLLAPSRVPEVNTREVPKWMEEDDIEAVIAGFGAAARLAASSGLDGVEVNAGQHSLVRQFLSGLTNQRDDRWGTDRTLFARRVLEAVREALGPGLVLGLRLSCDELAPWAGIVPEASSELAAALAPWTDYLTAVRGSIFSVSATRPDTHVEAGFNLALLPPLRRALPPDVALVAQGSIVSADLAHRALSEGADAVEMTRSQIADPDLVRSLSDGRQFRPCILCNQACQVRDNRNPLVSCVGEPSSGHELQDPEIPTSLPRPSAAEPAARPRPDVLVVGGGPAGLECARVAALSGHRVRLLEARARTGGMLRVAANGAGRGPLAGLADWLEAACQQAGVEIRTGRVATARDLSRAAGTVILATGSRNGRAVYRIGRGARIVSAAAALEDPSRLEAEGPWAVWDPIGGPIGISVAELLAGTGRTVHLVTPDLLPGNELARTGDLAPANTRLQAAGVRLERRCLLRMAGARALTLEDRFSGAVRQLAVVGLVDAGHRLPEDSLWRRSGRRLPRVGDAVAPRSVYEAVLEGRRAALALGAADRGALLLPLVEAAAT